MDLVEVVAREVKKHRGKACDTRPLETCPDDGVGPCFCREEALAYVEALRSAGALQEWRPIAEAPKDGTPVLVFQGVTQLPLIAKWERQKSADSSPDAGFWRIVMTTSPTPHSPTHFMLLPPPPKENT